MSRCAAKQRHTSTINSAASHAGNGRLQRPRPPQLFVDQARRRCRRATTAMRRRRKGRNVAWRLWSASSKGPSTIRYAPVADALSSREHPGWLWYTRDSKGLVQSARGHRGAARKQRVRGAPRGWRSQPPPKWLTKPANVADGSKGWSSALSQIGLSPNGIGAPAMRNAKTRHLTNLASTCRRCVWQPKLKT